MKSTYTIMKHDGIYEIVRVNPVKCEVVQTNIRNQSKAEVACRIWEAREAKDDVPVGKTQV
jgi:hypothetical protein